MVATIVCAREHGNSSPFGSSLPVKTRFGLARGRSSAWPGRRSAAELVLSHTLARSPMPTSIDAQSRAGLDRLEAAPAGGRARRRCWPWDGGWCRSLGFGPELARYALCLRTRYSKRKRWGASTSPPGGVAGSGVPGTVRRIPPNRAGRARPAPVSARRRSSPAEPARLAGPTCRCCDDFTTFHMLGASRRLELVPLSSIRTLTSRAR